MSQSGTPKKNDWKVPDTSWRAFEVSRGYVTSTSPHKIFFSKMFHGVTGGQISKPQLTSVPGCAMDRVRVRVRVRVRAHISRIIVILSCPHVSSSHCTHHVIHWPRSLSDCQLWCAVEVVVSFRYPSLFLVSHLNIFSSLRSFPCMSQR